MIQLKKKKKKQIYQKVFIYLRNVLFYKGILTILVHSITYFYILYANKITFNGDGCAVQ